MAIMFKRITDKVICREVEAAFIVDGLPATVEYLTFLMALPEKRIVTALERARKRGKLRCVGGKWWLLEPHS